MIALNLTDIIEQESSTIADILNDLYKNKIVEVYIENLVEVVTGYNNPTVPLRIVYLGEDLISVSI